MKYDPRNRTYVLDPDDPYDKPLLERCILHGWPCGEWTGLPPRYVVPAEIASAVFTPEDLAQAYARTMEDYTPW